MDDKRSVRHSVVTPELYFLISKFLKDSPLQETAQILIKELEDQKILPKRIDWTGEEHDQSFTELERKYSHIRPNHLLEICCRIGPILDKELIPSVAGVISLLGTGRQSLLRTKESVCRPRTLLDYYTRIHGMPLPDSLNCKPTHNSLKVLIGRESSVSIRRNLLIPTSFYSRTQLLRRTLGHLSAVYCVLFDRSGRYIITGADDFLVKLWSAIDGRLLTTFRGASAEITDIAVNIDNTLLAAGSLDRILRVWDLQTAAPIAVLPGHTGMITSVNFCPSPRGDLKYLVTTSTDGSVAFWQYTTPRGAKTVFAPKPTQYHEKVRPGNAQMICASFSPGGIFLAAGSADPYVRVYLMQEDGPKRVLEAESHGDAVDSIQWAHRGLKFVSGSKDGTALVWTFESQQWKSLKLTMSERLSSCPEPEEGKKLKVTMVSWDFSDKWVMTAVNDFSIKIWDSKTGCLHKVLRGHRDEVYVLESHPKDEHVLLSAGHDSQLFIWDIVSGTPIAHFVNNVDDQMPGRVFDAKWSPDGSMIAATDSHGHMLMFGVGINKDRFTKLPEELFFHTDYRPLIRDSNHLVMDEQTQTMPHLMLPPFLVDVDGNPHPPEYQRFVPGRENCPSDQLVPNTAVGPDGVEVIDEHERSQIDFLIEALANRQGQNNPPPDSNNDPESRERNNSLNRSNSISRFSNTSRQGVVVRRAADVEGVRQSSGNWQRDTTFKWGCRIYLRPMKYAQLQAIKQIVYSAGQDELDIYRRELRRRPIMITTGSNGSSQNALNRSRNARGMRSIRNQRRGPRPAYRTRAAREREPIEEIREEEEDEEEEEESASNSGDSSFSTAINEDMLSASSTSDSETSDYSDWVADKPGPNLEPPKRAKRKRVQRREISPSSDNSQPRTSEQGQGKKKYPPPGSDVAEAYRPPEWLSEIIPRKAPYYPQMGDEVVYFRQGHQKYLDAVRDKKVYKLTNSSAPWNSLTLRDHELVRVIGIKYEIRPPRLCCLKLALINRDGQMTGQTFTIKYHDMPDVLDFFVLRQTYDLAVARNWSPGHRFRCMIDDGWWIGQIESRLALSPEFPDSLFMCFRVRWDNGEYEYMSPWDLEPIDESRLPQEHGGAVPVLPEEIRATLYQPKTEEWPRGDRDASCRRIIAGLEKVMVLAIADPFLAPVDLNVYPEYAYIVEYPIDLTTIKARFENHFYRRITSAQFDVRYLATNAEKFNKPHSSIVRNARIVTDLCLRIIRDPNDVDVGPVYHQLADTYKSSESENDNDDDDPNQPGPSSRSRSPQKKTTRGRAKRQQRPVTDWRIDCRELLEMIYKCDDSEPFREPVDTLEHPDYLQVIDSPMDLRTVKEDLFGGNYSSPLDFAKDMRLIIQNSKNYNTNKRSRIYSMTIRLSNLFETQLKEVIHNWKIARRRGGTASPKKTPNKRLAAPRKGPKPGPSNCNGNSLSRRKNTSDSDDDDDDDDNDDNVDDDDDDNDNCRPRGSNVRTRNNRISRRAVGNTNTNGVSSTVPASSLPSSSNRGIRKNVSQPNSQGDDDDSADSSSSDSSSTSSSDDTEEDKGIPVLDLGNGNRLRKFLKNRHGNDSEDSYKPTGQNRKTAQKRRRNMKKNKKAKKPLKRKHMSDDNDNDDNRTRKRSKVPKKIESSSNSTSESDDSLDKTNAKEEENGQKRPRGRPKKTTPSEILNASRRTRQQREEQDDREAEEDETQNLENSHGRGRNNRRYDSDHSYHVSSRTTRRVFLESDTEQDFVRPTRSTARKANLAWGREEDSLEEEHDDEVEIPRSIKKPIAKQSRRKKSSESDYSQDDRNIATSSSRRNNSSFRQVRTNRNSRVLPDEESDDEPVLSRHEASSSRLLRPTRNLIDYRTPSVDPLPRTLREQHYSSRQNGISNSNNGNNSVQRRIPATITSSSTVTRSHANSTTNVDAMPSSSTATLRSHSFRSHVQVDHNYGEPGPSSMRNTRRMLSRHQRNADELDQLCDVDPLQIPTQIENVSSRLRIRNTVNSTTTGRPRSEGLERALRSGRNARPRYSDEVEDDNNDDDNNGSEDVEDEENTDEHVDDERRLNVEQDNDVSDNDTDSEDNQPLRYMVDASTSRKRSNLDRSNILKQSRLRNRRSNSDADYVGIKYNGSARSSTRNRKRPRYNEDSDETGEDGPHGKRRTGMRSSPSPPHHRNQYNNATSTSRNSHPADDNDDTDEHEQTISISSRGRVRKITAKARGLFRD